MNCQICGKPSGFFPLCKDCNELKDKGTVVKCEECGTWHQADRACTCTEHHGTCIICGKETAKGYLCLNHFKEKNELKNTFEQDLTVSQYKNHYYNLKNSIFNIWNMDYAKTACLRLIALSDVLFDRYHMKDLLEKAESDVHNLLTLKAEYLNKKHKTEKTAESSPEDKEAVVDSELNLEDEEDFRKAYPMNIRCKDGHYVRSLSEKMIDDYLWDHEILHIYEKKVTDFETEEKFYCDFYLPNVAGGVYIEHFGLEEEKYLAKKERKIKFYNRNKFSLIITEQKHTENLEDYLDTNIKKKMKEYEKK